ncbi:uncharacterized protein LOC110847812 [Folsomia candida]|uniref:ATP synthase F(0) complex subunit e, mitochondrial n=1 Tax=Folsomia candida TaxID=158441 RepID=A0A226EJT2_FOLCA|nr:uncharacterized protein LOC110847812 [Folsomia candida]OXA57955.1 hypothetical protein Fcan01_07185 [Folsomia candida]
MSSLPEPRAPHALIKLSRWTMLSLGLFYGFQRNKVLSRRETARRAKEEEERPAREAALKAEKDKKYNEDMEYLGRETGVIAPGTVPGGGRVGADSKFQSECGCKY